MKNNIIELVKYLPFKDYILNNENASKSIKLSKLMDNDYNPYISIPITLDNNDCIICLSNENKNHNHIFNIKDYNRKLKGCNCNYNIHSSCIINTMCYNDSSEYKCVVCKKLCISEFGISDLCLYNFDNIDLSNKSRQYIINYKQKYIEIDRFKVVISLILVTVIIFIISFSYYLVSQHKTEFIK